MPKAKASTFDRGASNRPSGWQKRAAPSAGQQETAEDMVRLSSRHGDRLV
jgi:hypothetical protein